MTIAATDNSGWYAVGFITFIVLLVWGAYYLTNRHRLGAQRDEREFRRKGFEAQLKREAEEGKRAEHYHETALRKSLLEAQLLELQVEIAKAELEQRKAEAGVGGVTGSELNKLHATKVVKESDLLEVQVELARRDLALRADHLDYHDAMMEKSKLEIESLKLRIREQRKDLDGFGQSGD